MNTAPWTEIVGTPLQKAELSACCLCGFALSRAPHVCLWSPAAAGEKAHGQEMRWQKVSIVFLECDSPADQTLI